MIPEKPAGLAESILEIRLNTEARIEFGSEQNLSCFWMSKAAKSFEIAHEEADLRLKSSKSAAVVSNVIGATEKEDLSIKIRNVLFSVLNDESTDISRTQNLCIIVRFYDAEPGKITSRFWVLYQIFNEEDKSSEASAKHIFNCVEKSFQKYSVPLTNIIGFGSDGCDTMMGDKNSVRTRFEQRCPGIYIMKCLCHSLHLCASNACSELPPECEKLPQLVHNHFSVSSKRQYAYKRIQSILDLKQHKVLQPAQTRWLPWLLWW
ncbi:uncharacterized protein LOC113381200 [Ctenocephalides felis]|uniref:uncharacterized protein LOC113381200 n=1 Tax=Ctenocephalides felis TaxID=7515 RepID=UPI000E6E1F83|nr:uncharacterized protein LOC113381200 [Ctenocephalides felis]